jgi:U1 small nuclear ribonucleoprotein C
MPRFFDDYSNTYLTHDSAAGRKQQRRGWKFRENFKLHYESNVEDWRKGSMGLASAQQAYIRAKGRDDPMIPPLPDGWKEEVDEATTITYFYHDESGQRTWVRPGFIPPPPGPAGGRGAPPSQNFRGGGFRGGPPPPGNRPPPFYNNNHGGPPPQQYGGQPPPQPNMMQQPPHFQGGPPPPFQGGPPPPFQGGPPPQQYGMPPPRPSQGPPPRY